MPKNEPSCVKFKSWIIQDVFDVLWLNRSVVAAAVSWLALFAVFDAIVPHPALLGPDGVLSLGGTCWFVVRALVDAVALIVVGILAQLSCLTRQGGWGAILAANRKAVLCCSVGMWGLAVLTIAMVLVYQQFFVADIIRALLGSSREPSHSGRLLIGAFILVGFLGVIALGANWFPAVLAGADRSMRKTWQRGRGTFLYVIWRLVAVLLFLPVISTLIVPVIGLMVAIFHVLGIPADVAVLGVRALAAGVIACFVSMLLSVIFVRAFVISLK